MVQAEGSKSKGQKNKKQMLIRYGRMGFLGWFDHNEDKIPKVNSKVVIKTRRGLELGEIVGQHNYRGGQFRSTPEQVEEYYGGPSRDYPVGEGGSFVRFATHEDLMEQEHLEVSAREEAACCERFIKDMGLPMKVVDSEHLFGGERIVLYFSSNGRVDFRDLVRRLAREYQTRIELRQIGSRDEAKLVSDFESCGQECCCRRFLRVLEPVNMRMAKLQKATLDPSKISGHCGRLKCCLRYEDETYRDLKKRLPRRNTPVRTPKGVGKVASVQILTQLVMVQDAAGKREAFSMDEIEILDGQNVRAPREVREDKSSDAVAEGVGFVDDNDSIEGWVEDLVESDEADVVDNEAKVVNEGARVVKEEVAEPVSGEKGNEADKDKSRRRGRRNRGRNRNRRGGRSDGASSSGGKGNKNGGGNRQ